MHASGLPNIQVPLTKWRCPLAHSFTHSLAWLPCRNRRRSLKSTSLTRTNSTRQTADEAGQIPCWPSACRCIHLCICMATASTINHQSANHSDDGLRLLQVPHGPAWYVDIRRMDPIKPEARHALLACQKCSFIWLLSQRETDLSRLGKLGSVRCL